MFKEYPIKAIEEIASRLNNRSYTYKDLITNQGEDSSELMIIYSGEVGLFRDGNFNESSGTLTERSVIGTDELKPYTLMALSNRVKVLVLHKMFLKDTLFYVKEL